MKHGFSTEVAGRLKFYIYRLVDPRNGETFYVGKGKGDRVFQHVNLVTKRTTGGDTPEDLKTGRITAIQNSGLEVEIIIHRHGIDDVDTAYEVEAALIDAYPGLVNRVGGHRSSDFGVAHPTQLIAAYQAEEFIPKERLIAIAVPRSLDEEGKSILDAVRGVWKIDPDRASRYRLVLAHRQGLVVGAFRPLGNRWLPAIPRHFPWLDGSVEGRWGFEGENAEQSVRDHYLNKRIPSRYRKKGAANPIRFIE